jgi:hypothetical protein
MFLTLSLARTVKGAYAQRVGGYINHVPILEGLGPGRIGNFVCYEDGYVAFVPCAL